MLYSEGITSVTDTHHFDADPHPSVQFNADPDPSLQFNADSELVMPTLFSKVYLASHEDGNGDAYVDDDDGGVDVDVERTWTWVRK